MNIKEILSKSSEINFSPFTGRSKSGNFNDAEFRRITAGQSRIIASPSGVRKSLITLVPLKSLSLEDFNFPFSNSTKIRDALRLQTMPFSAAGELEIFPVIISKTPRGGSNGIVWYVSPEELELPESDNSAEHNKVWPAPLAFISKLSKFEGSGVTMWIDEENICSMLWQKNRPVLSRWRRVSPSQDLEARELDWYDQYCKTRELERGGNFTVNAAGDDRNPEADEIRK